MGAWKFVSIKSESSSLSGAVITENGCGSLTTRLPFDDDEFDHIHIKDIARGVPETKVRFLACVSTTLSDPRPAAVGLCVCSEY